MSPLEYRRVHVPKPRTYHKSADALTHYLIGLTKRRSSIVAHLATDARAVDFLAEENKTLSDTDLASRLAATRASFRRRQPLPEFATLEALALVTITAERSLGLRAHLNQLMAALALRRGYLAEMATGEGKTLAVGLAAVLAGWVGQPCHVVTSNDYLAQRDAEWLGKLYRHCGITVGFVTAAMPPEERREPYRQNLTYATSKELVADFLRDRLRLGLLQTPGRRLIRELATGPSAGRDDLVMQGIHTAIVDEADNVLIDEAVTPLIISEPRANDVFVEACLGAHRIAQQLTTGDDYIVATKFRDVRLTEAGLEKVDDLAAAIPEVWRAAARRTELIERSLQAREFYLRGKQYVVQEDEIVIVDDFTGRLMPGRTWQQGLHQAIEAKEGLAPSDPSETLARLSFQRFFRMFRHLSGLSGTARESAAELWRLYHLPVINIPANRPCRRREKPDRVFPFLKEKWEAVVEDIAEKHALGRPVLVGTRSVSASEHLAKKLTARGLPFQLLNAVRHAEEAAIIALAGGRGAITIATNMAGRGTDVKLAPGIAELGGLHVIATERHESRRIDRQLFGRAGRQGDPGSAQAFVSLEDELARRFVPLPVRQRLAQRIPRSLGASRAFAVALFPYAQKAAERLAASQREQVLKSDTWMEEALSFSINQSGT